MTQDRTTSPDSAAAAATPWRPSRTVAVVLAGGTGTRLGLGIPKQLLKIAGKPIIEHTLAVFEAAPEIDEIIVLMAAGHVAEAQQIVDKAGFRKVSKVVEGGDTRNATTRIALDAIGEGDVNILFHDAVRPLVSARIVRECVNALWTYSAVDVAIPSADTIIQVDEEECIVDIPVRSTLRRGQTPQAFRSGTIREAYRRAEGDPNFAATDDCGVVLRYLPGTPIKVIDGSDENIKVTHPVDVHLADKLFQLAAAQAPRLSDHRSYTEELAGRTVVIFGGSYGIGHDLAELARGYGAQVFPFSRSSTGTHVERAQDVEAALKTAFEATGRIDYVVVTAGILEKGALAEMDEETMDRVLQVNFVGPVIAARQSLPYLQQTKGQLLLYTSSSYTRGRAQYALYSATKAALVNLTQALADEWAEFGVRVNCVNPERTATPMRTKAFGQEPEHTLLSAEAVARSSLDVLISELTGQVIDVRRAPGEPVVAVPAQSTGGAEDELSSGVDAG
ncbi:MULTISPECIES: bifunctional cytidylyltransferase/SDR family oxidoreductase [Micromonospora]|uniref:2-C-methyl-D-erythritol 4-phosphate cytidylyltransferase n=1 Tax=Micromonospora solifontis TaxID=2487138 RepID=A0ABX9WID6_9ACTN|nr:MULTISPECIES: bifunctional cytidylyltransferase/SDR family oxidoreductase [Micromonospora]NES15518.1 bifunctional cytidylyltransferase/SDR family oxidoreductase [Micromonospora sp. PPF5-17B]NES36912.1 bifunctional cytidylyltransferase/SDR family oxidoreductase [Micromonospora solifontis]NES55255.1 bifunctional cytidylyltransferase/SDR family oxidoreductase [Micromonospora sp. PPF5-6]RNL98961.1 SDR family NAD(P)-dependent oxidoreductase [Micromonospora solifontis]